MTLIEQAVQPSCQTIVAEVARQIQQWIVQKGLCAGDYLAGERVLARQLGVGRGYVRLALQRLQWQGIVDIVPQRGARVRSNDSQDTLLAEWMAGLSELCARDLRSMVEMRVVLECQAVIWACARATERDVADLQMAHQRFLNAVSRGGSGLQEDMAFHLAIAAASQNAVLQSLLGFLASAVWRVSRRLDTCRCYRPKAALLEHQRILEAIIQRNQTVAEQAMRAHQEHWRALLEEYKGDL